MNSYFKALVDASFNGECPEFFDYWRIYHPTSNLIDSDIPEYRNSLISFVVNPGAVIGSLH